MNIWVQYTHGGGGAGNLEIGRVNALLGSIPRINRVENITPMRGGTDPPPQEKIEALGNKRFRHRFSALGVQDFEEIVLEKFQRVALAKCFPCTDGEGAYAQGHVCLVVMGRDLDGERMARLLCREIYAYLAPRCDCNLVAAGRLHVVHSTEVTVSTDALVFLRDLDLAAITQQQAAENIGRLLQTVWRARAIGDQIDVNEVYQVVKETPNVAAIGRILVEGAYQRDGRSRLVAIEGSTWLPFATVKNGTHRIRLAT
jgi:hypothetical protein